MKKITIIGCGWLGLPVAKNLIQQGIEVHGTTTREENLSILSKKDVIPHLLNLKVPNQDFSFLSESDAVLISFPPGLRKNTEEYPKQIEQLLEGLRQYLIQKIVFISSTSVYPSEGTFDEDSSIVVQTEKQKIMLETELAMIDYFDATVIRMGGLYGENRHPHNFIKKPQQLETNTEINFIHQSDAVELTTQLLLAKPTGIFNGVHPHHPLKFEFYKECYQLKDKPYDYTTPTRQSKRVINGKRMSEIDFKFKFTSHMDYLKL